MRKYALFTAFVCLTVFIFCSSAAAATPTSNFSANTTDVVAGGEIQFIDQSTGNPTSWIWDFDNDGTTDSIEQNPTYNYSTNGTYTVKLIAKNADGIATETKTNYIHVGPDLITSMHAPSNPKVSENYTLSYTVSNIGQGTTGSFVSWMYCNGKCLNKQTITNLGSGESKTFTFIWTPTTSGTYIFNARADVYAQVVESNESNNAANQQTIVVPNADFSATPTNGATPLTVQFTDLSTGNPTSWAWDFNNDGIVDSTDQNPVYTYNTDGIYTVKLTVSNSYGTAEEIKNDYIRVGKPDLVTSIQAPNNPEVGTAYPMSFTVTNNGLNDAGSFTAWIYYNGKLLFKQTINSLMAGSSRVITFNWTPTTTGTYTFNARADVYAQIVESNEKNNAANQTVTVIPTLPTKPDLVTSMILPENLQVGQTYSISYTVTNYGTEAGTFTSWMYINGKNVSKQIITSLAPGESQTFTFDWTPTTTGTYTFNARADVYAQIVESNEKNNAATQEITVTGSSS